MPSTDNTARGFLRQVYGTSIQANADHNQVLPRQYRPQPTQMLSFPGMRPAACRQTRRDENARCRQVFAQRRHVIQETGPKTGFLN